MARKGYVPKLVTGEERDAFFAEIDIFLEETGLSTGAFSMMVARSQSALARMRCKPASVRGAIERWRAKMADYRVQLEAEDRRAIKTIQKTGGYVSFKADGTPEVLPHGVSITQVERMRRRGWLVDTGDAMFNVKSQSAKVTDLGAMA